MSRSGASYLQQVATGTGLYQVVDASGTYAPTPIFGDAGSMGFAGTGAPAGIAGGLGWYKRFGYGAPGANVLKTTQGFYGNTLYYGPTTDDSAEGGSSTVFIKDDGNLGWAQTKQVIAWEANARVEGAAQALTSSVGGMGARLNVLGTAHVANGYGFKTSTQTDAGATGTIDNYKAFWQQAASGAAAAWGVYTIDAIQSEKSLVVAKSGDTGLFKADFAGSGGGNPAFVYVQNPQGTNMANMRFQAIAGQTAALIEFWAQGSSFVNASVTRLGSFISTAGFIFQNSAGTSFWSFDSNGPKWASATLIQTTVGAAGAAAALPASPSKYLKVVDSTGTTYVIPAFAAS